MNALPFYLETRAQEFDQLKQLFLMTYLVPSATSARFLEAHSLVQSKASFLYHVTPPLTKTAHEKY